MLSMVNRQKIAYDFYKFGQALKIQHHMRESKKSLSLTQSPPIWSKVDSVLLTVCLVISFVICWYFHDKGWEPRDEGNFGYLAQRMLDGDVIHRDFQMLHAGLINFTNALFLKLADGDMVGLRYPLVALTVIQSAIGYKLARRNGYLTAVTAVLVLTAFGFLQFINPTPVWYGMCLAILTAYLLDRPEKETTKTLILLGFIVGTTFLFRQLTGLYMAAAVATIIFLKNPSEGQTTNPVAGRNILYFLAFGLALSVLKTGHFAGLVFFGVFPVILIVIAANKSRVNLVDASNKVFKLSLGSIIAASPLIFYHTLHGSLNAWVFDAIFSNVTVAGMEWLDRFSFIDIPGYAVGSVVHGNTSALSGAYYWTALLLVPGILGLTVIRSFREKPTVVPVIGITASVYSLVAILIETSIYLSYSTGVVLLALLCTQNLKHKIKLVTFCISLSLIAIIFQAGESKKWFKETATNTRLLETTHFVPGHSIKVGADDSLKYEKLVQLINACTKTSDKIIAIPVNPEIYFLSKRQSAFKFVNSAVGFRSKNDVVEKVRNVMETKSPAMVLHNHSDSYFNTESSDSFLKGILPEYTHLGSIEEFEIYHRKSHTKRNDCAGFTFDPSIAD